MTRAARWRRTSDQGGLVTSARHQLPLGGRQRPVLVHPDLQGLRRIALWTRSARALYERFGFTPANVPSSTYLEIRPGPTIAVSEVASGD